MAQQAAVWGGTNAEMFDLANAANRECVCATTRDTCLHALMADQRGLDRLLFGRRIAGRLRTEEHSQPTVLVVVTE